MHHGSEMGWCQNALMSTAAAAQIIGSLRGETQVTKVSSALGLNKWLLSLSYSNVSWPQFPHRHDRASLGDFTTSTSSKIHTPRRVTFQQRGMRVGGNWLSLLSIAG